MRERPSTTQPPPTPDRWWLWSISTLATQHSQLAAGAAITSTDGPSSQGDAAYPTWLLAVAMAAALGIILWIIWCWRQRYLRFAWAAMGLLAGAALVPRLLISLDWFDFGRGHFWIDAAPTSVGFPAALVACVALVCDLFSRCKPTSDCNPAVSGGVPAVARNVGIGNAAASGNQALATTGHASPAAGRDQIITGDHASITYNNPDTAELARQLIADANERASREAAKRSVAEFRLQQLESENERLQEQVTAGVARVEQRAAAGDESAKQALDEARASVDANRLKEVLLAEATRKETEVRAFARDFLELHREIAAMCYLTGDIDQAEKSLNVILRLAPDDLDATNRLGQIYRHRGELPASETQYRRLIELAPDDQSCRAVALGNLGVIAQTRGDLDAAEKLIREALDINRRLERPEGQAAALGNLGVIAGTRGDLDAGEKLLRESLDIYRKLGNLEGQASQLGNLGNIAKTRGDLDAAEMQFRRLLELAPTHMSCQATALGNLGVIAQARGDLDLAGELFRKALDIDRRLGKREGQANHLCNLGVIAQTRGDLDAAEKLFREALDINRKLGRLEGQAIQLANFGVLARTRGDLDAAEKLHRESLEIERKLGRLEGQAADLGNLGLIAQTRGDLVAAEKLHREALDISRKLGSLEGQANQLGNLGLVAGTRGDLDGAERLYRGALNIFHGLGSLKGQADLLGNLGGIAEARGDLDAARQLWTEARDLYARVGIKPMVEKMQGWLDALPPPG